MNELKVMSYDLRKNVVDMIMAGKGGHIGGDMSMMDVMVTLYFKVMNISPENIDCPNRDRFILSKGHSVETLYAVLAKKGFFEIDKAINEFSKFGSKFIGHPNNKIPGIEMNSGSLGHGLPVAIGMALAGKMDNAPYRVYTIMGDGELDEGSVWEGIISASHFKLDNLCAIVDRNKLQLTGPTEEVMHHEDLQQRFESFGWHVIQADGHDYDSLSAAFDEAKETKGQPTMIIANTIKGYGASIMENKVGWHHHLPTEEEYKEIIEEFSARKEAAINE